MIWFVLYVSLLLVYVWYTLSREVAELRQQIFTLRVQVDHELNYDSDRMNALVEERRKRDEQDG